MAKSNNILGVQSLEIGAVGDGVMGTSLTEFTEIEVNSITLEGMQANEETIPTEGDASYLTVNSDATPTSLTVRLYGVTPTQLVMLAGGTVNGDVWEQPLTPPNIYLSARLKGTPIDGKYGLMEMPYAKVSARLQGNITKNSLPAVDVTLTANTPVSALGAVGVPFSVGTEDVS